MIKEIEKMYNNIISLTEKIPNKIKMTEETYKALVDECLDMKVKDFAEVLDKNKNPKNPFMGMKIEIVKNIDKFKIVR